MIKKILFYLASIFAFFYLVQLAARNPNIPDASFFFISAMFGLAGLCFIALIIQLLFKK